MWYVGYTSKTPQERFAQHREGGKFASPTVTRHGVHLLPELYERRNPVDPSEDPEKAELRLAKYLDARGYTVKGGEPGHEPGWWRIATADGPGEIRIRGDAATGVLDHDFRDPDEPGWTATVPARVVSNGRGADFVMTIFQPPELDDEAFDRWLADTATEFTTLKEVLERP